MTVLVTGGGGFLGLAVVKLLRERGLDVRSISRSAYDELDQLGVTQVQGDIADPKAVHQAVDGCEMVFHVAAKAGVWGSYESFYAPNVRGTANVIDACRTCGVTKLIYTSSPSVTFGGQDQDGVDEREPYPDSYLAHYPETKAEAERMVNAANGSDLATVSLRPHLIWGPGDNHLVPRVLEQGRKGRLKLVGGGRNLVDSVYIDNAATAHLNAADRLAPGSPIAGKNYFISNDEPMSMADLINGILAAGGVSPVKKSVSPALAYRAGAIMESTYRLLGLSGEPRMTRFVARQLATAHWFDIGAARRELGYQPSVSIEEGLNRLAHSLKAEQSQ